MEKTAAKDLYYTAGHEWISFKGTVAYIGISSFKLTGFKEIHAITFHKPCGLVQRGELVATVRYNDYRVDLHMPVDGKIIRLNETLLSGDKNVLVRYPESNGWVAMLTPSQLYERRGLMLPKEYQITQKRHYLK